MRLSEIADYLNARLITRDRGQGELTIHKIAPITEAGAGDITFIANPEYLKFAQDTKASAIILKDEIPGLNLPQVVHRDPYWAFAKTAQLFYQPDTGPRGVSGEAFVAHDASLGEGVTIYPWCYVSSGVKLGAGVVLYPGVYLGKNVTIGDNTIVHANVVIEDRCQVGRNVIIHAGTVIGADGFGFAVGEGEIVKIPQVGIVRIEDDVELGAACTVDRAAMGETVVKKSAKFDSKVHIGHNAIVGEDCLFSAHTATAGSAKIGKWVMAGGHAGVAGRLTVGDGAKIGAMSGVIKDAEGGETYMGFPAVPAQEWRRRQVYFKRLADYEKKMKTLEARLVQLGAKLEKR